MLRNLLSSVYNNFPIKNKTFSGSLRTYANFCKEFEVSQFCTLVIKCPYNINITPIDVFKSQEKVLINVHSEKESTIPDIEFIQDGDTVSVDIPPIDTAGSYTLSIYTSVKANLSVYGGNYDVTIGSFHGNFIDINCNNGNISLSKSQCEKISLIAGGGNITCKDLTQAGEIILKTVGSGKIITDRLQGLNLKVITEHGPITIGSSYCDKSSFETDTGQLTLQNLHKNATIRVNIEALLNMVGFDGKLQAHIRKGLADIQVAKLHNSSEIVLEEQSSLILRLSEECQKENIIDILTNNYILSDTLKMDCDQRKNSCTLSPLEQNEILGKLAVKCENSSVLVDSASWSELFKASIKKR